MKKRYWTLILILSFAISQAYAADPLSDLRSEWMEAFNINSPAIRAFYGKNSLLITPDGTTSGNNDIPAGLQTGLRPVVKITGVNILNACVQNSTKRLEIGYYETGDPVLTRVYLITGWDRAGKTWLRELDLLHPSSFDESKLKNDAQRGELDRIRNDFCAAANGHDVVKTVRILFDDASIIWDNGRLSRGEKAIAIRLKGMSHSGFFIRFKPDNIYFVDSDTAFELGQYEIVVGKSHYAFVWKKQPGGEWKVRLFFGYTSFGN